MKKTPPGAEDATGSEQDRNTYPGREGRIVGGEQRWRRLLHLEVVEASVVEVFLTLEKERELNVRLNRNQGDWDYELLAEHFDRESLEEWGFEEVELEESGAWIDGNAPKSQKKNQVQEKTKTVTPPQPRTSPGDLWVLGPHRVPAPYPVALPIFFINILTDPEEIIYDPFLGSGSTLIAAQLTSRRAYGMEISPTYCDLIIARWEKYTGLKAERQPAGA